VYKHHTTKVQKQWKSNSKKWKLGRSFELHGLAATTWCWEMSIDISDTVMMRTITKALPAKQTLIYK
jgi:hypothetical protein